MLTAYRAIEVAAAPRLSGFPARFVTETDSLERALVVARRRFGRAVGGSVGAVFGIAAFASALARLDDSKTSVPAAWLLGGWVAAAACGWTSRGVAGLAVRKRLHRGTVAVGLQHAPLEAVDPLHAVRMLAMRWETASIALPLAASALLGPLTIHWLLYAVATGGHPEGFAVWMCASAILVGPAHLALAMAAVSWARGVRRRETELVAADMSQRWGRALGIACLVACFPGVLLFGVPPLLVAMTGVLFVPAMFTLAARRVVEERIALELV